MQFSGVRPDLIKFEMRKTEGRPAWVKEAKKPGFFGRLLSGIGRFFGAVAAPLSFIFPPAALAAAGMYGVSSIGDQIQAKAYQKRMQQDQQAQNVVFPGLGPGGGFQPASAVSPHNEMIMNVLFARDQSSLSMANGL